MLDQLTFGEHVDSPTATKLPMLLAVALLKDRNGVIDLDLPISGSLDDPKFSIGGLIIVQIIVNLITKIVTAPFALLGALAGGTASSSRTSSSRPGRAELSADGGDQASRRSRKRSPTVLRSSSTSPVAQFPTSIATA